MTTPLVTALYPPERRVIATSDGAPPKTRDDECRDFDADKKSLVNEEQPWRHRFTVKGNTNLIITSICRIMRIRNCESSIFSCYDRVQ
jgi:hypothetical protein